MIDVQKIILIKYGELTTKKKNRNVFIKLLANNIKKILINYEYSIKFDRTRMYIETDNVDEVVKKLKNVFGIHSIVICYKVNTNTDNIINSILKLVKEIDFKIYRLYFGCVLRYNNSNFGRET